MPQPPLSLPEIAKEPIGFDRNNFDDIWLKKMKELWSGVRNYALDLEETTEVKRDAFDFQLPHEVDPPELTYWGLAQLTREVKELKQELEYIKQRQNSQIKIYQMEDLKRYETKQLCVFRRLCNRKGYIIFYDRVAIG